MITLDQIAYNIKNLAYGGNTSTENQIGIVQIKHWVHYHRAKLIVDYAEKGILEDLTLYQPMQITLRNSTSSSITDYYKEWDEYERNSALGQPALSGVAEGNLPHSSNGKLTGEFLARSVLSKGSEDSYTNRSSRDWYGRKKNAGQDRGDFRNLGDHNFFIPTPITLKNNAGIRRIALDRIPHFPDDVVTTAVDEAINGYQKSPIELEEIKDQHWHTQNKFTKPNNKPHYSVHRSGGSEGQMTLAIGGIQASPNNFDNEGTPTNKKILWKYRAYADMLLENPTDIDMMWPLWWAPKQYWDDATTPYPLPMQYIPELIQRILQVELQITLKTIPDIITDGIDDTTKLKLSSGTQVQK
jgi:hypothetical protein